MNKRNLHNRKSSSSGFSLIEVMVSVLILAVGLLGVAAMQATSLKNTQSSMERSQAVIHTYAIIDSMRANVTAARANQYNVGWTCAAPAATNLVTRDIGDWINGIRVSSRMSNGCGRIACAASVCTVDVRWNDSRGTGDAVALSAYTVTTVSRL